MNRILKRTLQILNPLNIYLLAAAGVTKLCSLFYRPSPAYAKLANSHLGERCFMVGTGPSMTIEDLELLKGEDTFTMNSMIRSFPKTTWRPTYFGMTDSRGYKKLKSELLASPDFSKIPFFFSRQFIRYHGPNGVPIHTNTTHHHLSLLRDYSNRHVGISKHLDRYVNDGPTVVYSLIQVAIYMGYKEIYLIGTDCDYTQKTHSDIAAVHYDGQNTVNDGNKFIDGYISLQKSLPNDVKIYNCTRGGKLEVFPRVILEDVLATPKPGIKR